MRTSPTPWRALELHLDELVGDLGQLAHGTAAGERDASAPGRESLSILEMTGGSSSSGRSLQNGRDAVAHVLRGHVDVAVEAEGDDDEASCPCRRSSAARRCPRRC